MAGFNENADKKIKISSKPNAVTIEAIKEVQQMKSGAVTDKTSYDDVDKMISDILDNWYKTALLRRAVFAVLYAPPFLLLQVEIPAIRCYNKDIIFGKDSGKGKDMGYILKTAQYVNDFQCIGGKCTMDCCRNWDIIWTDEEIEKLKNSEHSESLDKLI